MSSVFIAKKSHKKDAYCLWTQREGFDMFNMMLDLRDQQVVEQLFENLGQERALTDEEKLALLEEQRLKEREAAERAKESANRMGGGPKPSPQRSLPGGQGRAPVLARPVTVRRTGAKVGRNDPCHCGSGKKYKKCHMLKDRQAGQSAPPA